MHTHTHTGFTHLVAFRVLLVLNTTQFLCSVQRAAYGDNTHANHKDTYIHACIYTHTNSSSPGALPCTLPQTRRASTQLGAVIKVVPASVSVLSDAFGNYRSLSLLGASGKACTRMISSSVCIYVCVYCLSGIFLPLDKIRKVTTKIPNKQLKLLHDLLQ
jgi:hypothetical protein